MSMAKYLFLFLGLVSQYAMYSQVLVINEKTGNASDLINDGFVELEVTGGTPPYTYKWSNPATPLNSSNATGLVEGLPYLVVVTDSRGISESRTFRIKPKRITEHFNGAAVPLVENLGSFLFWDPFSAIGIYDPVVYADVKKVPITGWEPGVEGLFTLKEWYVENGSLVEEGDLIAVVENSGLGEIDIFANATGRITRLSGPGEIIYDSNNSKDVIEVGAHNLAEIKYTQPVVVTHPNGDPVTRNIPLIVIWLIFGAAFFTVKMGFINFKGLKHSIDLARGIYDDPNAPGKITHFQTLTTAVAATVGLGNIAGVALAISIGGAGATFWMIIAGLLGMASKFVECTLGLKYRFINSEGKIFGGPMNYLEYGLEKRNMKWLGKFLAVFFAILCIGATMGGGNMFQANQSFEILAGQFEFMQGNGFYFGLALAALVGAVIFGGFGCLGNVIGSLVPVMAAVYIISAFVVIGVNFENI